MRIYDPTKVFQELSKYDPLIKCFLEEIEIKIETFNDLLKDHGFELKCVKKD